MDDRTYLLNLAELDWVHSIRDPIWGEIPITAIEQKIIQTEAFNRLRGVKQLSFAYLAFPGAIHTRFEHSIGVMHAADKLLAMIKPEETGKDVEVDRFSRQLLRLVALLHDIGHPPFSHAMENLFSYYPDILKKDPDSLPAKFRRFLDKNYQDSSDVLGRHETFTEFIIASDMFDVKQELRNWIKAEREIPVTRSVKLDAYADQIVEDVVAKLAAGQLPIEAQAPGGDPSLLKIFKSILSGDIDADKIDYLVRDNYYCGLTHDLDLTSLRNQLIWRPDAEGLELHPKAIGFVHALILARYRLITNVHHDQWDVFATAKVVELLHSMLHQEISPAAKIFEIFTKWEDSELIMYLLKEKDPAIKEILTTRYPIDELARLEFIETHPYIRECIQLLSEWKNHNQLPKLQEDLRRVTGDRELIVHVQRVKSPEFSMRLTGGGSLLRDEILRGISEESIKNLHLVVYGRTGSHLKIGLRLLGKRKPDAEFIGDCTANLSDEQIKQLLAELAVRRYRELAKGCGRSRSIMAADFLMLMMEQVGTIYEREQARSKKSKSVIEQPTRQDIYRIARLVFGNLADELTLIGSFDLKSIEISSAFYQEIRKYEQMGLISYTRITRNLPSEEGRPRTVFRPDRRFGLSEYGRGRLREVRRLARNFEEYRDYMKSWKLVERAIRSQERAIIEILRRPDTQAREG